MIFKLGLVTRANAEEIVQLVAATTRYATEMRFFSRAVRELLMEQLQIHTHTDVHRTHAHIDMLRMTQAKRKKSRSNIFICAQGQGARTLSRVGGREQKQQLQHHQATCCLQLVGKKAENKSK